MATVKLFGTLRLESGVRERRKRTERAKKRRLDPSRLFLPFSGASMMMVLMVAGALGKQHIHPVGDGSDHRGQVFSCRLFAAGEIHD